jgi:hypothetical protein
LTTSGQTNNDFSLLERVRVRAICVRKPLGDRVGLTRILGLRACRFEYGVAGLGQPARLQDDCQVEWNKSDWDVEREGLAVDIDIELLVESGGRLQGRFLLREAAGQHPSTAQRVVAVTLAAQVGAVLR